MQKKVTDNAKVASSVSTVNLINNQSNLKQLSSVSVLKYDNSVRSEDQIFNALPDIDFEES